MTTACILCGSPKDLKPYPSVWGELAICEKCETKADKRQAERIRKQAGKHE